MCRTFQEHFKLKKNKPSPAYGLQSKSLLAIHWVATADVFLAVYKVRWILLNFPHLLCSDFIAAVLISLHCGLGGDINTMWYRINLLCGSDVWLWFWMVSIDWTAGSAFNDSPVCTLKKPALQDAHVSQSRYLLYTRKNLCSVLRRCTHMHSWTYQILHEITWSLRKWDNCWWQMTMFIANALNFSLRWNCSKEEGRGRI